MVDNKIGDIKMKTIQLISSVTIIAILLAIFGCGANTPTTPSSTGNKNALAPNSPVINAYKGATHTDMITRNAIDLLLTSNNVSEKQKKLLAFYKISIEQGAWDEDYAPIDIPIFRTPNHFMDPIHNTGLTDWGLVSQPAGMIAIDWAQKGNPLQNPNPNIYNYEDTQKLFLKTIVMYNPDDPNKNTMSMTSAMFGLGHVLHMFQDMTSVPHTRNDNHAAEIGMTASGYENFVILGNYNPPPVSTYENIVDDKDLWNKFRYLATSTNANFFSEDTIPDPNKMPPKWRSFSQPVLPTGTGYLPNATNPIILATENRRTKQIEYTLDGKIHKAYADILVPRAISYTAGVIKYFLSLKGTGEVVIDNPLDYTTVYSPSADVSGHLTYYASSAIIYYHPAGTWSREKIEIPVTYDISTGRYVFSTASINTSIPLVSGDNQIEVVADNENVTAINGNLTITYNAGGGDDHDDNEEWWDDD